MTFDQSNVGSYVAKIETFLAVYQHVLSTCMCFQSFQVFRDI